MKVLISGASGLVGRELVRACAVSGHHVVTLGRLRTGSTTRHSQGSNFVLWHPDRREVHVSDFEGFDAVVHLAGEPILGRWTQTKKRRIRESRVKGTQFLVEVLDQVQLKPKVLLTASAIGYYGDTGDKEVDESAVGTDSPRDFLEDTCVEWENAAQRASASGIRTVQGRLGIVLSRQGGALKAMLPPFQLGLGGPIGSGQHWMSTISNHDVARAFLFLLEQESCLGAYNIVGPDPATNRHFSLCLGQALHRPAYHPVPAWAVRLFFGRECADATVLRSTRVLPTRLVQAGFAFDHPSCVEQIRWALTA
jgi:uncharacterized protein (TIGR01777 family)